MAITNIKPVKLGLNEMSAAMAFTAPAAAADGFAIDYLEQDTKILIIAKNGGSAGQTITFRKGDGIQGVADSEAFALAAGEIKCIVLESGKFKKMTGENKGCVVGIPSSKDVAVAAVVLP